MAYLIPETVLRLQATAFVRDAELAAIGRDRIIRHEAKHMAEMCLKKLLSDCIKTDDGYRGYQGQTLRLDVYVVTPDDLHELLAEARAKGERDAEVSQQGIEKWL